MLCSVRTRPGATAFARTPCLPQRDVMCRTERAEPALGHRVRGPLRLARERGAGAREHERAAAPLHEHRGSRGARRARGRASSVRMVRSNASSGMSTTSLSLSDRFARQVGGVGVEDVEPAVLARPPRRSASDTWSSSPMSMARPNARPPAATIRSATASAAVAVEVGDRDRAPFFGQPHARRGADPARAAGDDRDLARKSAHDHSPSDRDLDRPSPTRSERRIFGAPAPHVWSGRTMGRSLEGKVALVTGASAGGTGRSVAVRFAAEGARVAITARSLDGLAGDARPHRGGRRHRSRVAVRSQ